MKKIHTDLMVLSLLFFIWGFVTCLNDILIPHLKSAFELSYFQAALVQFTFFFAYFLLALPAGAVARRIGYQKTMVAGLVVAAVGALGFVPAASLISYPLFLAALFAIAAGVTLLQVAANPYVVVIGPEDTAARRLNLTQAFNSLGTTVAPIVGGALILTAGAGVNVVMGPYIGLAIVLLAAAVFIKIYPLPKVTGGESELVPRHQLRALLRYRHTCYGIAAIFLYVGAEVSIGSFLVNYLSEESSGAITHEKAAHYVALYWGGAMLGRFVGVALLQAISARTLMGIFTLMAGILVNVAVFGSGWPAMTALIAVGLFNSIMFPTIFALALEKLGDLTNAASSLLVMAIVGGAILPLLVGVMADIYSLKTGLLVPACCYFYLLYYSLFGSRVR